MEKEWGKEVFDHLSWYKAEVVKNAKVMVVGAGALGNEVLKNLALFGVGNIFIVDFDTIEYSNLTRSVLYRESDADKGLYKAEVAAQSVKEINPNINVQFVIGHLDSDVGLGIFREMDVVIGCLDSRLARLRLNRHCMRANVPWVDGGIENLTGNVKVYCQGENCYECGLLPSARLHLSQQMSCAGIAHRNEKVGRVPTTPVIASVIGAIQVQEAMKLLHKEELEKGIFSVLKGQMLHYEGMHNQVEVYDLAAFDDDCPSHELWDRIVKIEGLGADTRIDDALQMIHDKLNASEIQINLRNDKFVDYIVSRTDNRKFETMLPESKVGDFIDSNYELYTTSRAELFQNEYENIDSSFPYQELTLRQIGIPYFDIVQVSTENGCVYVELSADRGKYGF